MFPDVMVTMVLLYSVILSESNDGGKKCGIPHNVLLEDRIVGGYDVGYYKYSWFAVLIRDGEVSCGGALIGPKTILTAAHCYKEVIKAALNNHMKLEEYYIVKMGVYNICKTEKSQKEYIIDKVQIHELFVARDPYFDICLITLKENADFEPICLPKTAVVKRPREGIVPGLGRLKYKGKSPCAVQEARLLIYSDEECVKMIKSTGNNPKKLLHAFCAGYLAGGIDTCQGDSGGPLQVLNKDGQLVLLGIVSYGFNCADKGLLGIYTDVSRYVDWIKNKSGIEYFPPDNNYEQNNVSSSTHIAQVQTTSTELPAYSYFPVTVNESETDTTPANHLPPIRPHRYRPFLRPINIIIINRKGQTVTKRHHIFKYKKWNMMASNRKHREEKPHLKL